VGILRRYGKNTFSSLKIRNYRLYFFGQAVSMSGTWMQTVALGWLVLSVTGSGSQLGLVTALQFLPLTLLGPWGGVMTDRMDKRKLLIWTQTAFGSLAGILSVLVYLNAAPTGIIYLFALGLGFVRIFDNPARQTFVSEMVPGSELKNAVSLNATVNNLARAVGPSIGGILIATIGIATCFLFNALSYVAVIAMLFVMREAELHKAKPARKKKGQIVEGLHYVAAHPRIRDILVIIGVVGTFAYEFQVSLPILAEQTFQSGAAGYASLMSSFGLGAVVGGIFAAGRKRMSLQQFAVSLGLFGVSIILVALAPTLPLAIIGMAIVGVFSINVTALGNTMLQLEAAPGMRGRVMALWSVAMIGSTPIGGPIVGWMGEHMGARWGIAIGGISALMMVLYMLAVWEWSRREARLRPVPATVEIESHHARIRNTKVE
jgi:MFS family permease